MVRRAAPAVVAGTAGVLAIAAWDGGDDPFGIGFTFAALAAAALIWGLVILDEQGLCRVFAWRPAVAFGRVSYGFYLWHLPILRWTDDRLGGSPGVVRIGLGLVLALAATLVSYRLIEQPALRLKSRFAASATTPEGTHLPVPEQSTAVSATNDVHD
jgi:peptidoglycan/LPS O-acetylase OafA/YrhL